MDFKIMNKLFVYGTLKKKHSRNSVLSASTFLGEMKTVPKYTMIDLGAFPGIFETGNTNIYGELYLVEDSLLELCDLIEGHPDFYERKKIILSNKTKAWSYFLEKDKYIDHTVIKEGIW